MTRHAGTLVAFAGLLAAFLAGAPAVALLSTFGSERNWIYDARGDALRLAALAAAGLAALVLGLALAPPGQRRPAAGALSLGCLAAAALWLLLCLVFAATATSESLPGLAQSLA